MEIIRKSSTNPGGSQLHKGNQCLAEADDIVLIARSEKEIQSVMKNL